jgi:hypothetical protein
VSPRARVGAAANTRSPTIAANARRDIRRCDRPQVPVMTMILA